ncbi:hypothetical protein BDV19DRAFT_67827 [Aspergillus venezuelensis]
MRPRITYDSKLATTRLKYKRLVTLVRRLSYSRLSSCGVQMRRTWRAIFFRPLLTHCNAATLCLLTRTTVQITFQRFSVSMLGILKSIKPTGAFSRGHPRIFRRLQPGKLRSSDVPLH